MKHWHFWSCAVGPVHLTQSVWCMTFTTGTWEQSGLRPRGPGSKVARARPSHPTSQGLCP